MAVSDAGFGQGKGPILINHAMCSGSELSLFSCKHDATQRYYCEHSDDAGVICDTGEYM